MTLPLLDPFFLVGGTALALQLGHRVSVDLDLFSIQDFSQDDLRTALPELFDVEVQVTSPSIFITSIDNIKVDFVRFRYPILYPVLLIDGVRMLDLRDIAPMKLDAAAKRGTKKDFFDLYFLLKEMTLREMIGLYDQKFQHSTVFHIIKSLTYFDDAEEDPDPIVFDNDVTWEKVKDDLIKNVQTFYAGSCL